MMRERASAARSGRNPVNDDRLNDALDRIVPDIPSAKRWDDVLDCARRIRRRRHRRTAIVALAAGAATLVASLAASGQIGLPVDHAHAPHLVVRATLVRPDGTRAGAIELELIRGMVAFGRHVVAQPFVDRKGGATTGTEAVRTHWFLTLDDDLATGTLSIRARGAGGTASSQTLCVSCGSRRSGSLDLPASRVSQLLNRQAIFVVTNDDRVVASGPAMLDRSQLRRGLLCSGFGTGHLRCMRMYTGRP
jgi:hypothetical protein